MALIGALLGCLLGLVLAGALLLLLVPIRFALRAMVAEGHAEAAAQLSWGAGLLSLHLAPGEGVELSLARQRIYHSSGRSAALSRRSERARSRRAGWRLGPRFLWRVGRRIVGSLRLRVRFWGRLGTGDPADTAKVFALLAAARGLLPSLDARGVRIDWIEPALELEGRCAGRLWPVAIVWIVLGEYISARRPRAAQEA